MFGIFGERGLLTLDWKAQPAQMPHFKMGTPHLKTEFVIKWGLTHVVQI